MKCLNVIGDLAHLLNCEIIFGISGFKRNGGKNFLAQNFIIEKRRNLTLKSLVVSV